MRLPTKFTFLARILFNLINCLVNFYAAYLWFGPTQKLPIFVILVLELDGTVLKHVSGYKYLSTSSVDVT